MIDPYFPWLGCTTGITYVALASAMLNMCLIYGKPPLIDDASVWWMDNPPQGYRSFVFYAKPE